MYNKCSKHMFYYYINNIQLLLILQITIANKCPQLTPNDQYTLHMNIDQQLIINGKNFIQVFTNCILVWF